MRPTLRSASLLLMLFVLLAQTAAAAQDPPVRPLRILITNDNGIDDPKVVALARAFAPHAETWVIAPAVNRSGTGSFLSLVSSGSIAVEPRDLGDGIRAFAVHGYPADCVVLGLLGLMKDSPPDLVVSGINGGPNLGADWFGSGTIGAARVAALAGVRAIAVSGLDDDLPGSVSAAVEWVVRFVASDAVRQLEPPAYLTIALPRIPPDSIRGVRVADRAALAIVPRLERSDTGSWRVAGADTIARTAPADSDQSLWDSGYIVVTPMRADEVDLQRLAQWRRRGVAFPAWLRGN